MSYVKKKIFDKNEPLKFYPDPNPYYKRNYEEFKIKYEELVNEFEKEIAKNYGGPISLPLTEKEHGNFYKFNLACYVLINRMDFFLNILLLNNNIVNLDYINRLEELKELLRNNIKNILIEDFESKKIEDRDIIIRIVYFFKKILNEYSYKLHEIFEKSRVIFIPKIIPPGYNFTFDNEYDEYINKIFAILLIFTENINKGFNSYVYSEKRLKNLANLLNKTNKKNEDDSTDDDDEGTEGGSNTSDYEDESESESESDW